MHKDEASEDGQCPLKSNQEAKWGREGDRDSDILTGKIIVFSYSHKEFLSGNLPGFKEVLLSPPPFPNNKERKHKNKELRTAHCLAPFFMLYLINDRKCKA